MALVRVVEVDSVVQTLGLQAVVVDSGEDLAKVVGVDSAGDLAKAVGAALTMAMVALAGNVVAQARLVVVVVEEEAAEGMRAAVQGVVVVVKMGTSPEIALINLQVAERATNVVRKVTSHVNVRTHLVVEAEEPAINVAKKAILHVTVRMRPRMIVVQGHVDLAAKKGTFPGIVLVVVGIANPLAVASVASGVVKRVVVVDLEVASVVGLGVEASVTQRVVKKAVVVLAVHPPKAESKMEVSVVVGLGVATMMPVAAAAALVAILMVAENVVSRGILRAIVPMHQRETLTVVIVGKMVTLPKTARKRKLLIPVDHLLLHTYLPSRQKKRLLCSVP